MYKMFFSSRKFICHNKYVFPVINGGNDSDLKVSMTLDFIRFK